MNFDSIRILIVMSRKTHFNFINRLYVSASLGKVVESFVSGIDLQEHWPFYRNSLTLSRNFRFKIVILEIHLLP